jgi:lipopolysaccharide/colanic/teichoic acid biosynthesis glycosyltransferase
LALIGTLFFLPFWVVFSFLIWVEDEGSFFYIQERIGRYGRGFNTLKFRTLSNISKNSFITTRLGRFLRITALDESLQLINILKGEMSFVGPRPLISQEIGENNELAFRFLVRPGLTGLAQVLLPKNAPVLEKFKLDLWYIENQNLILDLRLMFVSILISFRGKWEGQKDNLNKWLHIYNSL